MKRKKKGNKRKTGQAKRAAAAAGIGLATTGLSSCIDNGAVDPPPPPFSCTDVSQPAQFRAIVAELTGTELRVQVETLAAQSNWQNVTVTNLTNATLDSISVENPFVLSVTVTLDSIQVTTVSFEINATLIDPFGGATTCQITRTLAVDIASQTVTVAQADVGSLPLPVLEQPRITVLARTPTHLHLEAQSGVAGAEPVWAVTAGTITPTDVRRATWELPPEPGFYQAEVTVDYGDGGVGFDVLAVEVTG